MNEVLLWTQAEMQCQQSRPALNRAAKLVMSLPPHPCLSILSLFPHSQILSALLLPKVSSCLSHRACHHYHTPLRKMVSSPIHVACLRDQLA